MAQSSAWVRAPASGLLNSSVRLGDHVSRGQVLGRIADPFGEASEAVHARHDGILIGCSRLPLVLEGDALYHVASFEAADEVADEVLAFQEEHT